jgi:glycine/D-amino acid oxidase-like deaminating enzyme
MSAGRGASAVIVGGGVFGMTTALELRRRGFSVELLDPGPVPHPAASSTDISKAVRMDYGADRFYALLGREALDGWRAWNRVWGEALFHEVGILLLAGQPLEHGGFEADGFAVLRGLGIPVERMEAAALATRFPPWHAAGYRDGYFNPQAGWAASASVVARLAREADAAGVKIRLEARVSGLVTSGSRVAGVRLASGEEVRADGVIVAAGAWTPMLLPHLAELMWPVGQPVVHFRPADPAPFLGERFPVWCADIARTGWYGFPVDAGGRLKIGHHGAGRRIGPGDPLEINDDERARFHEFVERTFPALAGAPIVGTRLCLYCDTWDGNFLIDHDPVHPGLFVAAGGSGHGFKFAPVLGPIVADAFERKPNPWTERFAWRRPGPRATEAARYLGE